MSVYLSITSSSLSVASPLYTLPPPLPISLSSGHARSPAQSATGSLGDEGAGGDGGTMAVMVAVE